MGFAVTRRLRASGEWALGVSILAAAMGLAVVDGAQSAGPAMAPGFCPAPSPHPDGSDTFDWAPPSLATAGRSQQQRAYVDCRQLSERQRGVRDRIDVYGVVTLYRGKDLVVDAFPFLAAKRAAEKRATSGREVNFETLIADAPDLRMAGVAPALSSRSASDAAEAGEAASAARAAEVFGELAAGRLSGDMLFRTEFIVAGAPLEDAPRPPEASAPQADRLFLRMTGVAVSPSGGNAVSRSLVMPYDGRDTLQYVYASLRAGLSADRFALAAVD